MVENKSNTKIPLILGTMTFAAPDAPGSRISDREVVKRLIDCFKSYDGGGTTEQLLGELNLSEVSLDSKCYPVNPGDHSPERLRDSLDESLKALKVKKIRVFYLHAPDRSVPFETTLEECLSNFAAWEVARVWEICNRNDYVRPTVYQAMYNAITRSIQDELIPCCRALNIRVVVYNPLAGGFFAGKINKLETEVERGSRFDPDQRLGRMYRDRYLKQSYFEALDLMNSVLKTHGDLNLLEVGARWLQHHSVLDSKDGIIFGASSLDQIEMNCKNSEGGPLPEDVIEALERSWKLVKAELSFPEILEKFIYLLFLMLFLFDKLLSVVRLTGDKSIV
ncbi:NADP-dependent oxidoreductase domain-containing protein [Phakopsora pachyrhizi]|uniref:NADP-dependent oxidoreductase domain-containing protein n=1 Tax=Phakopsora pachyrhizi TaxID=170000 RepID=A0AAV0ANS9_PHAPC|nr:NADP-dependent oxidoreductase domain-containing protein [Phakopsora pachyrhizi]